MAANNINPHPRAWQKHHSTVLSNDHNTRADALLITAAKGGIVLRSLKPVVVDADLHVSATLHVREAVIESLVANNITFGDPLKCNALRLRRLDHGRLQLQRRASSGWRTMSII